MSSNKNPAWWLLYIIVLILFGLLRLEWDTPLSLLDHKLAESMIIMVMFGSVMLWLKWDESAIMNQDRERYREARSGIHTQREQGRRRK
jgi:hypothetical protein